MAVGGKGGKGDVVVTERVRLKKWRWCGKVVNTERYERVCETGRRKSDGGMGGPDEWRGGE